jgi:hypothetical protein
LDYINQINIHPPKKEVIFNHVVILIADASLAFSPPFIAPNCFDNFFSG